LLLYNNLDSLLLSFITYLLIILFLERDPSGRGARGPRAAVEAPSAVGQRLRTTRTEKKKKNKNKTKKTRVRSRPAARRVADDTQVASSTPGRRARVRNGCRHRMHWRTTATLAQPLVHSSRRPWARNPPSRWSIEPSHGVIHARVGPQLRGAGCTSRTGRPLGDNRANPLSSASLDEPDASGCCASGRPGFGPSMGGGQAMFS